MQIYNYAHGTGEFLFEETAELDPVAQLPMIPGNATDIAPPAFVAGFVWCFDESTRTWSSIPNHRGETWYRADGSAEIITSIGTPPSYLSQTPPVKSVAQVAQERIAFINANCDTTINMIKKGYPESEISSWTKQEDEARKYMVDPNTSVPFITQLATIRGVAITDLVVRIINKADAYVMYVSSTVGKRQALEDRINAIVADMSKTDAEKIVSINEVVW